MKWAVFYCVLVYVVFCADATPTWLDPHTFRQRVVRAAVWPWTVTCWFKAQNSRLFRMLHIMWVLTITSWFLTLLNDRFFG